MAKLLLRFTKQWIAGEDAKDAIRKARESNRRGIRGIINLLGEHTMSMEEVRTTANEYLGILKTLKEEGVEASISVKPTQLGLSFDEALCYENLEGLAKEAKSLGNFIWIDMEGSNYTQSTINLYSSLLKSYDCVGIAIQANLKRSANDVRGILLNDGKVRLCKGAYSESDEVAYKEKTEIDSNYSRLMKMLFEGGEGFAIATHDDKLIEEAIQLHQKHQKDFEFEMLLGIRDELKLQLVQKGYRVSEYIPYGKSWLPYSIRRLRERKRNILLILRSLFSR